MIKRDITETVYEYDKEGKLVKKTVTETHEEDGNTTVTWPYITTNPCRVPDIYCNTTDATKIKDLQTYLSDHANTISTTDATWTGGKATTTTTAYNCAQE
ncbi:MAG: hypothetical protein IJ444_02140 [Kiritimatiellae bacterium]|nr:hypothetical protein [Kiritimatiellia bacterium]